MKNEIVHRVYDFLKDYPPFTLLTPADLMSLSAQVVVRFIPKNQLLFSIGENPGSYFYVVHTGAIHLSQEDGSLVDQCDEGDVFGLRPLLAKSPYLLRAEAAENTLLYAIPTATFSPLLAQNPAISTYLISNFAAGIGAMYHASGAEVSDAALPASDYLTELLPLPTDRRKPVTGTPELSIRQAAQRMAQEGVGSLLICNENNFPVGILTDKDLRNKVVGGNIRMEQPVTDLMSSPVLCVREGLALAQLQLMMMKNKIRHLAITQDGTPDSAVLGVISEHDLVIQQTQNPAVFSKEINRKSSTVADLRRIREQIDGLMERYLQQEVSIPLVLEIVSELNDQIIQKCVTQAAEEAGYSEAAHGTFCWLALGSEGRQEQILRTDQDSALVYEPVEDDAKTKEVYLNLAKKTVDYLHEVGFDYCPANMMASNSDWCQTLTNWKHTFRKWIHQPGETEVLMTTIFFDFRAIYGDKSLAEALSAHIIACLARDEVYLHMLARNAVQNPPPLSFFRNFIVEKNGDHQHEFDIKARAMMPLADAARLLLLAHKHMPPPSTLRRFEKLKELEPQHAELYQLAADAYEILVRLRALNGQRNKDSGRYFNPDELDKMMRLSLRNSFQPIAEIQKLIKIRFQLTGILA
ncbi:DUF294 nucleotidyltransferase-like domain-containing protein [Arundinibacter roseus]|uniref:CBS domain-containing protein n=1 Tax=Arundinibacter roseus TaxID=2070510 RepID=A0A4R4K5M4_9BACT|nr:DUF294 nucleotidyltransferase-like domain-containing protein [Arundinibacter roseus]TDB61816.1 CBS domain-containing protein [Arundinibacter roseus]